MTYIISDIHGHLRLFERLMEKINLSDGDTLYICGDIIEKGEDSVKLLRLISSMQNARVIRGNHEEAFLKYYHALMKENDDYDKVLELLKAYIEGDGRLLEWDTVDYLDTLPYYIEADDFICTHAGLPLDSLGRVPPLETVPAEELLYNRRFKAPDLLPVASKCVFFGHTSTESVSDRPEIIEYKRCEGTPRSIKDYIKVHLDTGVFSSGVLGCFCIEACRATYVKKQDF